MVLICAVLNCPNRFRIGSPITFHRFPPSSSERLKAWLKNMRRENFVPTTFSKICSAHFTPDCFETRYTNKRLREDSEPTIFDFSSPERSIFPKKVTAGQHATATRFSLRTMPSTCSAVNCSTQYSRDAEMRIYRFPLKNKELCKQWVSATRRMAWKPTAASFLCSRHFEDGCFKIVKGRAILHDEAVPTIFDIPRDMRAFPASRRKILKQDYGSRFVSHGNSSKSQAKVSTGSNLSMRDVINGSLSVEALMNSPRVVLTDCLNSVRSSNPGTAAVTKATPTPKISATNPLVSSKVVETALQVLLSGKRDIVLSMPGSGQSFKIVQIPNKTAIPTADVIEPGRSVLKPLNPQPREPDVTVWNKAVEEAIHFLQTTKNTFVHLRISNTAPALKVIKIQSKLPMSDTTVLGKVPIPPTKKKILAKIPIESAKQTTSVHVPVPATQPNISAKVPIPRIKQRKSAHFPLLATKWDTAVVAKQILPVPVTTSQQNIPVHEPVPEEQDVPVHTSVPQEIQDMPLNDHTYNPSSDSCTCKCNCKKCKDAPRNQAQAIEKSRKLKVANQFIRRQKKKLDTLEEKITSQELKIEKLKEGPASLEQAIDALKHHLKESVYNFMLAQLLPENGKRKMAWHPAIKELVLTIHRDSPRSFRMMKKIFEVPTLSTLNIHERLLKDLVHLENELLFSTSQLDEKRKVILFDDDESENNITLIASEASLLDSAIVTVAETGGNQEELYYIEKPDDQVMYVLQTEDGNLEYQTAIETEGMNSLTQPNVVILENPRDLTSVSVPVVQESALQDVSHETLERENSLQSNAIECHAALTTEEMNSLTQPNVVILEDPSALVSLSVPVVQESEDRSQSVVIDEYEVIHELAHSQEQLSSTLLRLTERCADSVKSVREECQDFGQMIVKDAESEDGNSSDSIESPGCSSTVPRPDLPSTSFQQPLCLVCDDHATGFHYGVMVCHGCRAFFKRIVDSNVEYTCQYSNDCDVNKNKRRLCKACRYQKCIKVGMVKEAFGTKLQGRRKNRKRIDCGSEVPHKKSRIEENAWRML